MNFIYKKEKKKMYKISTEEKKKNISNNAYKHYLHKFL